MRPETTDQESSSCMLPSGEEARRALELNQSELSYFKAGISVITKLMSAVPETLARSAGCQSHRDLPDLESVPSRHDFPAPRIDHSCGFDSRQVSPASPAYGAGEKPVRT